MCLSLISIISSVFLSVQSPVYGEGEIVRVVDGDTYVLRVGTSELLSMMESGVSSKIVDKSDLSVKLRMFGINTPESVHPDKRKNTKEGVEISKYVKSYLNGREVEYICFGIGYYGRPLCSIGVEGRDFGIHLIENCMSDYVTKYGEHPYFHDEYEAAMKSRSC